MRLGTLHHGQHSLRSQVREDQGPNTGPELWSSPMRRHAQLRQVSSAASCPRSCSLTDTRSLQGLYSQARSESIVSFVKRTFRMTRPPLSGLGLHPREPLETVPTRRAHDACRRDLALEHLCRRYHRPDQTPTSRHCAFCCCLAYEYAPTTKLLTRRA